MPDRWARLKALGRPLSAAEKRQESLYVALAKPRTQAELRDMLGFSNSGILNILRRMERRGLVRPAERIAHTRIWERAEASVAPHSLSGSFDSQTVGYTKTPLRSPARTLQRKKQR